MSLGAREGFLISSDIALEPCRIFVENTLFPRIAREREVRHYKFRML